MTVTPADIIARVARQLGGDTGTVAAGATATSVVLTQLIGVSNDNNAKLGWTLYLPASAAADAARVVTAWNASTGAATVAALGTPPASGATFYLIPAKTYTIQQIRDAINDTLEKTKHTVRAVIPSIPNDREHPVRHLTWLRSRKDIDAVHARPSPCLLDNEDFSKWQAVDTAPDSWTLVGANAVVARSTSHASRGDYTAQLTSGAGAAAQLTQDVYLPYARWLWAIAAEKRLLVAALVQCSTANAARVGVNTGGATTYSSYHTGGGGLELRTAEVTLASTATRIQVVLECAAGANAALWDAVYLVPGGTMPDMLEEAGSSAYWESEVAAIPQAVGSVSGRITLRSWGSQGIQLVVYTRRPFATLATDTAETDCPEDVLFHGVMWQLAYALRPSEDRTKPDRQLLNHRRAYTSLASLLIDLPVPETQPTVVLTGT